MARDSYVSVVMGLSCQASGMAEHRASSIDGDDDEADEGESEREVDCGEVHDGTQVDDGSLERGKNATAKNGHDQTRCAKLGVVAQAA